MCGFWMQQSITLMSVWFRPVFYLKCALFGCDAILKELNIDNFIMRSLLYGQQITCYLHIYSAEKPTRLYIIFQSLGNLLYCY